MKGESYKFHTGDKVAIFSYKGCTLEVCGKATSIYISKDTPMIQYLKCHASLEQLRDMAEKDDMLGPVALIAGAKDVGKSTLCRILLNYAARVNRQPLYCDIDLGQGSLSVPGMISAVSVQRPAQVTDGFCQSVALSYHHGHKSFGENIALFNIIVKELAEVAVNSIEQSKSCESLNIFL